MIFLSDNEIAIQALTALSQAISTVVLVGITIYYSIQTKKIVDITEKNSKLDFLPILVLGYKSATDNSVVLVLNNIGKGIARKPKIYFPGFKERESNSLYAADRKEHHFLFNIDQLLNLPVYDRRIVVEYTDIFSRIIKTEATVIEDERDSKGNRRIKLDNWYVVLP